MRIAIIDDDNDFLSAATTVLEKEGHEVVAFSESEKGLKQVRDGNFDVLVTDVFMPHVDGIEVIRSLRKSRPNLWIVAISGGGEVLTAGATLRFSEVFGADRVLRKPFRRAELLAALVRS